LVSDAGLPQDPSEVLATGDGISRGRLRRTAPLAALSARTAGEAIVVGLRSKLTGADSSEFHVRTAERYTELLGRSKGALMKAGQMLSLASAGPGVPAGLQSVYQTSLARLRSEAPPMAPELARQALESELHCSIESAFAHFDWEPMAAASIGQVHSAWLHDGRAVAVKVQYPGVADAIAADLQNTELLGTFLRLVINWISPQRVKWDIHAYAEELQTHVTEELDYRLEAANQAEFAERYRGHPFIHVPDVIGELCSERMLTQELVQGISWNDALSARQELRNSWAEAIYRFYWGSYDRFHLFNADPHPGNYIFHEDGSVSFLDFGCVKRLNKDQADMMDAILRACLRGDELATWRASVEAGFWRSSDPVTPAEVLDWWCKDSPMLCRDPDFKVTTDSLARYIARRFSPAGPSANAIRWATPPPDCSIMTRIELGVYSAIANLRATVNWGSIAAEHFENGDPVTAMGKCNREFFDEHQTTQSHA
jgi:predicted unusual protein kinase regulating ubiquinone biosynthesis (AarF/ABC1/UbiB family)